MADRPSDTYPNLDAHARGCTDSDQIAWIRMRKEAAAALAEIARLRADLERLEAGVPKTADGVPITFGMTVLMADPDGDAFAKPVAGQVTGIYANQHDYAGGVAIGFGDWEGGNLEVYSSRDAFARRHATGGVA